MGRRDALPALRPGALGRSAVVVGEAMTQHDAAPVTAIRLRKEGAYTVVDAEIEGVFVEVIRQPSDWCICHIVETTGMRV